GIFVVPFVTVGLRKAHDVEPVPAPTLPVTRRRQQPIDQPLIRCARAVLDKRRDFLGRGRQAGEVEGHSANQLACRGRFAGGQAFFLELDADELVDRVSAPLLQQVGDGGTLHGAKRPVLAVPGNGGWSRWFVAARRPRPDASLLNPEGNVL